MKKLKIAVGVHGNFVFLEKFPDDEEHQGCNEQLTEMETDCVLDSLPGVYEATLQWETGSFFHPEYDMSDAYLNIDEMEKLD